jgi:copper(I)-binding protein
MKIPGFRAPCLIVFVLAALTALPVHADDSRSVGDLRIERPWSRATPPGTPVGAGYMTIVNTADEPDRLIAAGSPAAGRVQIHRSVKKDGTSSMMHQKDGVVVPPEGRLEFSPGGYHLMLMQLEAPLEQGQRVPVTLQFERAGRIQVDLMVRALTAGPPKQD